MCNTAVMAYWRRGAELARDGEPAGVPSPDLGKPLSPTGQCAACHQLEPRDAGVSSSAPSLIGYGARRGYDWQQSLLLYEQIYNSNAVVACSTMPRFGARKVLTPEQIRDIVAYLLAPQSPVNAGTGPHAHGRAAIPN